jgi:ribosomal protein S27AE
MEKKKKLCAGCGEMTYIWANREGRKLCKQCSYTGVAKLSISKPTTKKPIPPRSQKRSKEEKLYSAKRVLYLQDHPMCEAHLPGICTDYATDIHHMSGKIGDLLTDEKYFKALCRSCHQYVETHPEIAKEKGLSINRLTK